MLCEKLKDGDCVEKPFADSGRLGGSVMEWDLVEIGFDGCKSVREPVEAEK